MTPKEISNYLAKMDCDSNQRIEKEGGGQYLHYFLKDFADHVAKKTKAEIVSNIRKIDVCRN